MQCDSEPLPSLNQWSYSEKGSVYAGSDLTTPLLSTSTTEYSQSEDEMDTTDLFRNSILKTDMRNRKPTANKSILQSPYREKMISEKSVNWKDNLVEYRYIDGNPAGRRSVDWGSVMYAVMLIVSSYIVYCMLHSIGIKPRGLR